MPGWAGLRDSSGCESSISSHVSARRARQATGWKNSAVYVLLFMSPKDLSRNPDNETLDK